MDASNGSFDKYSLYYDLLYSDKDYDSEVRYILKLLQLFRIESGGILEFGSGTGKHADLLIRAGFEVSGIEMSQKMIDCSEPNVRPHLINGDIRSTALPKKFNAVISLFHVMSYMNSNDDVAKAFLNASNHLAEGGIFIFDFWYTPAVLFQRPEVRVKNMSNEMISVIRVAEPRSISSRNIVEVNYRIFIKSESSDLWETFSERHSMRHFSLPELDFIANECGFERVLAESFMTGENPSESTWGVCASFRKKAYA